MTTAACSHNLPGGTSKAARDCLYPVRAACPPVTTDQPAGDGYAISRASQIELDVESILNGMHNPHRNSQIPEYTDQIE